MKNILYFLYLLIGLGINNSYANTPSVKAVLKNGFVQQLKSDTILLDASDNLVILFSDKATHDSLYHYTLENYDTDYKRDSLPLVIYDNLEDGVYRFYLSNEENRVDKGQLLTIIVEGSFFENWGFFPFLLVYLMLLFGGAGYFILLSNFRSKTKLLDLRRDWTNKLHNDIGGDLSSMSLRLGNLSKKMDKIDPAIGKSYNKIHTILQDVQQKLRFAFDLIDSKKNSLHVMLADLQNFAEQGCNITNIALEYDNKLDPTTHYHIDIRRINKLYYAAKEVINNSIKYSQASFASIHIFHKKEGLHIHIKDNGVGFDLEKPIASNGVNNLREYSREGLMDIDIQSAPKEGTIVTIFAPYL